MKLLFSLILTLFTQFALGQNLVPNPSFENYNNCPTNFSTHYSWGLQFSPSYSDFPTVTDWIGPLWGSTSDYLNACVLYTNFVNVPNTGAGYQEARTGNAFIGLYMYNGQDTTYREFAEAKLTQPMIMGHDYYVSFFVNLGTRDHNLPSSIGTMQYKLVAIDSIAIHFSDTLVIDSNNHLNLPAHIASPEGQFLTDTVEWMKVHGIYTAMGNEQWLVLGKFYHGINPPHIYIPPVTNNPVGLGYYFVDDVCVLDISTPIAFNTTDTVYTNIFPITLTGQTVGDEYIWNTGDTSSSISVVASGTYWRYKFGDCSYIVDTIRVISPDQVLVFGDPQQVIIYPNPFTTSTKLIFRSDQKKKYDLRIYSITGMLVRQIEKIQTDEVIIERNDLSTGCYFYELKSEEEAVAKGKLFVQ